MARSILMVTGAYWPELSGGGLQCRTMIHALRSKYRFSVLTTCIDRTLPATGDVEGVPVQRIYVDLARPITKVTAALRTIAFFALRQSRFDTVHLHGFSQKSVLIVLLAQLFRKKLILTIHTAGHDEASFVRQQGRLAYWAYRQADRYIAISPGMTRNFLDAGLPESRLRVAANGVDVARFRRPTAAERDAARQALGLSSELRWILFVGFFSREKAPDLLFDAWLRLQQTTAPASGLIFVGDTDSEYYEVDKSLVGEIATRADRHGLSDRVRFTGRLQQIETAYHAADVFVMPSTREAFGMVLVEAMASALPVIATQIAGVTDEIVADGRTGLLVPASDVNALATAIGRVLDDDTFARQLGAEAQTAVTAKFAIDAASNRWAAIYDGVA